MVPALGNQHRVGLDLVDETMFVVDSARPVPGESVLERFRFTDALERRASNVLNQEIDSLEKFAVRLLPMKIVIPSMLGEDQLHSRSSFSVPAPASNSAIDSNNRRAFRGLRSRYAVSSSAW